MKGKRFQPEEVKIVYEMWGCRLLSSYIKASESMTYVCTCGRNVCNSFNQFRALVQRNEKACYHGKLHHSMEGVTKFFEEHGCKLLTDTYTGCTQILTFLCACGRQTAETSFTAFRTNDGGHCRLCGQEARSRKCRANMNDPVVLAKRRATWQQIYGTDNPFQNTEVKQRREKTCMERYGVRSVCQDPDIKARQSAAHTGDNHFMRKPESLARYRQTMIDRYGAPSLAFVSGRSSIEGQTFFKAVFNEMPPELHGKCYFSPKTHEFNVWYNNEYFKYDFVHSGLKKAIEYNGSRFHPRQEQNENEVGWCLYHPTRTVREARAFEERKLNGLRSRGYEVLVIWDHEAHHNFDLAVSKCIDFLGLKPGTP